MRRNGPRCCPPPIWKRWYARRRELADAGVDSELAVRVASGDISAAVLDIAEVRGELRAQRSNSSPSVYFALGTLLNYGWIAERAMSLPAPTHWDMLARAGALAELARLKRALTVSALEQSRGIDSAEGIVENWRSKRQDALERYARLVAELRATGGASLSMLLVVVREMAVLERA